MGLNTHLQAHQKSKELKCYWKMKCAELIILKHCINITQNIRLSPFIWRACRRLWGASLATIALGTLLLSSLGLLRSQGHFGPRVRIL